MLKKPTQGALIAFSSLSALYNIVEIRPLFLRERSNAYYRLELHAPFFLTLNLVLPWF